ncbi:hypothetical protein [Streptomyces brasiliensis]|uniref:Molecular chaperone DnaJ n=1 Tax=Streptomyces brasiliensis TaxID=1954 RepID=A0A917KIL7_9ACTN|nr:hypothetical protein [Streptomyces brasiliensis]GGJ15335.1 hypothetical protein GCM10010121_027510 [Streptomyces brasiliensis]
MARKTAKPNVKQCPACHGTGEVSRQVRVGRKHRHVGEQTGVCLGCLGAGEIPADD